MPEILLETPDATARLATLVAPRLRAGDVIGLSGDLGAGKSHFARALITARLAAIGRREDIPSPSYTLVQTYDLGDVDLWHVDLYRLGEPNEICELGIDEAFETCIVLVEWFDRLGSETPDRHLRLEFDFDQESETVRRIRMTPRGKCWNWVDGIQPQMENST